MKNTLRLGYLAVLSLFALALAGCPANNEFGGSVDISKICADAQCSELMNNPVVSLSEQKPLSAYLEVTNGMKTDTTGGGQTVRTRRVEITYLAPSGPTIPYQVQEVVANIGPGSTLAVPVQIFSYTQIEYVRDRMSQFPDPPYQIGCSITLFYDTSGGQQGSVQRNLSMVVDY